ncbi:MAG: ECF-type sigma factor [Marinicellaceae bacterium]
MSQNHEVLSPKEITLLIDKASGGNSSALNQLIPIIYPELKRIASGIKRKHFNVSKTLNTTALVNEAWIKLDKYGVKATNRKHFFCITAKAMRQIIMNSSTEKLTKKRHADLVTFDDFGINEEEDAQWMLQLNSILQSLESSNTRLAEVFQLKYFLGFTETEVADLLSITDRTVRRDWIVVKKIIKEIMS